MIKPLNCSLVALALAAGGLQAAELSPGLQQQLADSPSGTELKVLLLLNEQADIAQLDRELHERCASFDERHEMVIRSLKDVASSSQPRVLEQLDALKAQGKLLGYTPHWLINSVIARMPVEAVPELTGLQGVDRVEADLVAELIEPLRPDIEDGALRDDIGITPGVQAINADRVWYELGITGEGVLVGCLDTGVNANHEALSSRWRGNTAPAEEAWLDVLGSSSFPSDSHGHGSHVMGTIAGLAANDSIGVAPGAEWIACNAINQGSGSAFDNDILAAFEWFADPDGNELTTADVPDVVQNSWGVNESFSGYVDCDSRWWTAIDNCEAAGVVVTWSAGNEGPSAGTHRSPADRAETPTSSFSVGSTITDAPYTISSFSSRGPSTCGDAAYPTKPEVCAPGSNIYSVDALGGYTYKSGTSMAGPHVAGVVGLMRAANPDLDVITIKEILMETAVDLGSVGEDNTYGHGMVDAFVAVQMAMTGFAEVRGTVTDQATLLPIEGVQVQVLGGASQLTDETGGYLFNLAAGDYTLEYSYFGYETASEMVMVVEDTPVTQDVALNTVPSAMLEGVVRDADDQPVSGAVVEVLDTPLAAQTTGLDGAYGFSLPVGETFTVRSRSSAADETLPLGPDTYGYRAFDPSDADWEEAEVTIPAEGLQRDMQGRNRTSAFPHVLIDPEQGGAGTAIVYGENDDDLTLTLDLPFTFPYYGQDYDQISICANGWIAMGETTNNDYSGYEIPDPDDGPLAMLAPFWEDMSPQTAESGNVSTYYNSAAGAFIVEFNNVRQYFPADAFETFAVHLLDPAVHETETGDGAFLFWYGDLTNTDNTAVGIESPDGMDGLQYWHGKDDGVNVPGGTLGEHCDPFVSGLSILFSTGMLELNAPELTPITDLTITVNGALVTLDWSAVPAADSYRILSSPMLGAPYVEEATQAQTQWTGPMPGDMRLYQVMPLQND